jgi:transcriptional regulator with XRE-family HTH domain
LLAIPVRGETVRNFGLQPIRNTVWRKGYTHTEFAAMTGIEPQSHVIGAIRGYVPPSEDLRKIAPAILGVPLDELFNADALAEVCQPLAPGLRRRSLKNNRPVTWAVHQS